jgi:outer membrane protein assembly factor BamB
MSLLTALPNLALALLPPQSADWAQYHGSAGDRTSSGELALRAWSDDGPPAVWRVPTEHGFSSFAVTGGRAYTLVGRELDGDRREVCVALDAETGEELWAQPLTSPDYDGGGDAGAGDNRGGDGPRSTPSVADGRVYVLDADLGLYCFDAVTGEEVWSHDLMEEFEGRNIRWQNAASPLVEGELVFVAGGGEYGSLLAFDRVSGDLVWGVGNERMTHATPIAATIHGVRQVIFLVQSGLVAVEPETGTMLWQADFPYRTSTGASPVVSGDLVYVSAGYGVGAGVFRVSKEGDRFETEQLWYKRNKLINHWSTPVCVDGFLYGMFSFKEYGDGPLMCVELETGETQWSIDGFGPGNCIAVGDTLVALSDAGEVVLVEATPEAYGELARADVLDGKCWSMPAFSEGQLYVRSSQEGARLDLSGRSGE